MQALQSFWAELSPYLDFHKVDGLHEPGLGSKHAGVEASPGSGDDLPASTVDGIGMQGHIVHIEANTTHVLLTQDALGKGSKAVKQLWGQKAAYTRMLCSLSLLISTGVSAYWCSLGVGPTAESTAAHLVHRGATQHFIFLTNELRISYSYLQFISTISQSTEAFY